MKKERKQYGVTKPKSLDFLLAIMFAIVGVSALYIGLWITFTNSQSLANEILVLTERALIGSFVESADGWLVIAESIIIYGAIFGCVILSLYEICRKKFKSIAGLFALVVFGFAFSMQLAFLVKYLLSGISGLFSVFLIMFMLCELYFAFLLCKLLYSMIIKQSKEYEKYKAEFVASEAKPEHQLRIERIEKPKEKIEEKPEIIEIVREEPKVYEPEDDYDFVFTNSNDYKEYMYHENIVRYMQNEDAEEKVEEKKPIEEKVEKEVKKQQEKDAESNKFGGAMGNNFTFEQKLKMAKPVVKKYFKEITTYFVSLGFTPALTKQAETFSYKNNKCASITTAGKNGLKVYYKLDVKDYEDSTIPVKYVGDVRKYENTPLLFVAKSDLAVKRAKKLMDDVKSKLN